MVVGVGPMGKRKGRHTVLASGQYDCLMQEQWINCGNMCVPVYICLYVCTCVYVCVQILNILAV